MQVVSQSRIRPDVTSQEEVKNAHQGCTWDTYGSHDVLINNAGLMAIGTAQRILATDEWIHDRYSTSRVAVRSRAALPVFPEQKQWSLIKHRIRLQLRVFSPGWHRVQRPKFVCGLSRRTRFTKVVAASRTTDYSEPARDSELKFAATTNRAAISWWTSQACNSRRIGRSSFAFA